MNDEQVFQLLAETNPVPDPDGLDSPLALTELERGSLTMATGHQVTTEQTTPKPDGGGNRRNGPLLGVAAAALVLIVGIGTWAVIGGNQDAADGPEVAVVLSAYEAMNNGDIDGWFATLTEKAAAADSRDLRQFQVNMNSTTELIEPCRLLEPSPTSGLARVQCKVSITDDYHDPGGIEITGTHTYVITDEGKIDVVIEQFEYDNAVFFGYNEDFFDWLESTYPDVHDDIEPRDGSSLPGFLGDPADMLTALEYINEFVAQSDKYPLPDPSTP